MQAASRLAADALAVAGAHRSAARLGLPPPAAACVRCPRIRRRRRVRPTPRPPADASRSPRAWHACIPAPAPITVHHHARPRAPRTCTCTALVPNVVATHRRTRTSHNTILTIHSNYLTYLRPNELTQSQNITRLKNCGELGTV